MSQPTKNKRTTASRPPKGHTVGVFILPKKGSKFNATSSALATGTGWVQPNRDPKAAPKRVSKNKLTANIVADLIIDFCNEHGNLITNLQLQKLLYYCQAWHLALFGNRMFEDAFEAWIHGPTEPKTFKRFEHLYQSPIVQPNSNWLVAKSVTKHIENVMSAYGHMTAFELERLACQEAPWVLTRKGLPIDLPSNSIIAVDEILKYYKSHHDT